MVRLPVAEMAEVDYEAVVTMEASTAMAVMAALATTETAQETLQPVRALEASRAVEVVASRCPDHPLRC